MEHPPQAPLHGLNEVARQLIQAQHDAPVLIALFDSQDRLMWANSAFRSSYGLSADGHPTWSEMMLDSQHRGVGSVIETDDLEHWLASACSRRGKLPYRAFEADLHDGRWIWMTETVSAEGIMLCVGCDITHLRHGERLLRQQRDLALRAAITDPLTGMGNRGYIMELLDAQLDKVRQGQSSCGLVLLDLDRFKRVNDRFGHNAGDRVLRHFADLLPQVLRREDCCGRIGGEEFLLLLPNVDIFGLCRSVQRLIDILPQHRPLPEAPDFFYTCSAGATMLQPGDTPDTAMRRADLSLYAAKNQGRNRLVSADALPTQAQLQ